MIGFIIRKEFERMKALKRWEKAANLAVTDRFVEARPFYEQSYPICPGMADSYITMARNYL